MKFTITAFVFLFSLILTAQKSIEDYIIIVPEQYDFVKGKDAYQLNSMTVFKLKKLGLQAFFSKESPEYTRCEVLYADVKIEKRFLGTKLVVVLNDCDGNELYRSEEGTSKEKEYRKAYQDALRKAFQKIEGTAIELTATPFTSTKTQNDSVNTLETQTTTTVVANNTVEKNSKETINDTNAPSSKFTYYKKGNDTYLLKKTNMGYSFYKEDATTEELTIIGMLEMVDTLKFYVTQSNGTIVKGYFNSNGTMIINSSDGEETYAKID